VVTDVVPAGANYLGGGILVGNQVSGIVPSLVSGGAISVQFTVSATDTITNNTYRVSSSEGVSATGTIPVVTLIDIPLAGLSATNSSPTLLGQATTFTAVLTAGNYIQYTWAWGDGTMGQGAMTAHSYGAVGVYTAVVTASNAVNQLTATTVVTVQEVIVGLTAVNDSPTPLGNTTTLSATITSGSQVSYTWQLGDDTVAYGPVVTHSYGSAGMFTATVTAVNAVSVLSATAMVTMVTPVQADFVAVNRSGVVPLTAVFSNTSTGDFDSSLWDFGDDGSSAELHPSHTYTSSGAYTVTLTVSGRGGTNTLTRTAYITVLAQYEIYLPLVRAADVP
jgi:PKD repeat protein